MEIVEQNYQTGEEEHDSNEKEERDSGYDLRDVPLLESVEPVLTTPPDLARAPVQPGVVLLDPLLDNDPDRGGGKTKYQRDKPESVDPYCVGRCDEWGRARDEVTVSWLSRVHERRRCAEASELVGDLGEERIRLIRSSRLEKLICLDHKGGQNGREQTSL